MNGKILGKIGIVQDDRASRERTRNIGRIADMLRRYAYVDLLRADSQEDEVASRLQSEGYRLILAPWHKYVHWQKLEGILGLTRTQGPDMLGYFAEPSGFSEIAADVRPGNRASFLDFSQLSPAEAALLILAHGRDETRSGIRSFHSQDTPVYTENWYAPNPLGARLDVVTGLPEVKEHWASRNNPLRICLVALWSLIYEEGPGKGDMGQTGNAPKASFQIAASQKSLTLRLCFNMPNWKPTDTVKNFWPGTGGPQSAAQLLLRNADFVRVLNVADTPGIELVAGFLPSASGENAASGSSTLIVSPIAPNWVSETPFESPGPDAPHLKLLPAVGDIAPKPATPPRSEKERHKDKLLMEAAVKMKEMKAALAEREEMIRDLKSGGVGTAQPLPPPDAEGLLEAFRERYYDAKYEIQEFQSRIDGMEAQGAEKHEIEKLRVRMNALIRREKEWIRMIADTLAAFRGGAGDASKTGTGV